MRLSPLNDTAKISNIVASTGIKPIAGLGFDAAPPINIIIENQTQISGSPPSENHSQQALTDALAIYNAYSQLAPAPSLTQSQLNTLIDAFGTTEDTTSKRPLHNLENFAVATEKNSQIALVARPLQNHPLFLEIL